MRFFRITLISVALSLLSAAPSSGQTVDHWETVVFNYDIWSYFVGTSEPDANWRTLTFNDASWLKGQGGFGYADNDDNTIIAQCISVFIRHKFIVTDTSAVENALLSIDYDDAFVAYINDIEIGRAGLTGVHPAYNQTGTDHEATMYQGGQPETYIIDKKLLRQCLRQGENVLAIQVHNSSLSSSDLSSNAFLSFAINNKSHDYRQVPPWFSPPVIFSSSNLPLIIINTDQGTGIPDEPKITADIKIIDNGAGKRNFISDSGNVYTGKAGIEIRGSYSASLPQKPYGFETRDAAGNNLNVSLLGMPAENDWILLAQYNDKTFLRNLLAFDIFRKMGNYSTRSSYCEVIVNNEYMGIYQLCEKIKQDKGRVNIAKLKTTDNYGDDVTGGYIIKNDYYYPTDSWKSSFSPVNKPGAEVYFVYHDPKPDELSDQQKRYIQGFINSLEMVLYNPSFNAAIFGYRSYIDTKSFADYFILEELTRNVDAYKKSRYYFKNKDSKDGLLHSGPPWDFDWGWRNLNDDCVHFNNSDGSGWAYLVNECDPWPVPPSWEVRMLQDNYFANLIHNRYFELRKTVLNSASMEHTIDSVAQLLDEAQLRHFQKWKILGINTGTSETGVQPSTYNGVIIQFKKWITTRLAWLDANMIGSTTATETLTADGLKCRVFPNPFENVLFIESGTEITRITLFTLSGIIVSEKTGLCTYSYNTDVSGLKPGIYFARIVFSTGEIATARVVKR